jgi:hypothetical protein
MSPQDKRTASFALVSLGLLTALWFAFFAGDRPIPAPASPPIAQQPEVESLPSERAVELAPVARADAEQHSPPASASEARVNASVPDPSKLELAVRFLRAADPERFGKLTLEEAAALTTLSLRGAKVTDADLANLAAMPLLDTLILHGTAVTDAGLVHLSALRNLKSLDLRATQVSGAGLSTLATLGLEALHLTDTRVTGEDLRFVPMQPNLRTLKLNGTSFTDDAVGNLVFAPSVTHLEIDRTAITDAGLRELLAQNRALTRVELRSCAVSMATIAELKKDHPGVELVYDSPVAGHGRW